MRKNFVVFLVLLFLAGYAAPALAAPSAEATPAAIIGEDGASAAQEEAPSQFMSYIGGIALLAVVILSVRERARAIQNGDTGGHG